MWYWPYGCVAKCTCIPPAPCYTVNSLACGTLPPCQVIFTDPYYAAEHNRHTSPQLDADVAALHADVAARVAASQLKVGAPAAALPVSLQCSDLFVIAPGLLARSCSCTPCPEPPPSPSGSAPAPSALPAGEVH